MVASILARSAGAMDAVLEQTTRRPWRVGRSFSCVCRVSLAQIGRWITGGEIVLSGLESCGSFAVLSKYKPSPLTPAPTRVGARLASARGSLCAAPPAAPVSG